MNEFIKKYIILIFIFFIRSYCILFATIVTEKIVLLNAILVLLLSSRFIKK